MLVTKRKFSLTKRFAPKCLIVDLEVKPSQNNQPDTILMIGALRPDSEQSLECRIQGDLEQRLTQLDALAEQASFLLGHNIIHHDLPTLQHYKKDMALLNLPCIDTLLLSPLAFPQNPYHRLIKDYKLIRDSLNSPLSDCRATLELFEDQQQAFALLKQEREQELLCYQALLAKDKSSPLWPFFMTLTKRLPIKLAEVKKQITALLKETDQSFERKSKVCQTRLQQLLDEDLLDETQHLAIAYVLAWLRVSGGNSVLAPWVGHQYPQVKQMIRQLRDVPCSSPSCSYCQETHNPRKELQRYFGFDDFRYEQAGHSLQRDIVSAGMSAEHVLAVLATGGGKSLCYQLPALNRYHRNASLTVIVSPLQSLMKDQVDGLLEHNIHCAATLNGLLSLPERADVLDKIQMGDIGLLLVSPEQFRNKAFRRVIKQRQVGAWVFDEAHCLSKWGNDFRPDYLYVSRFIKEYTGDNELAPVSCFTATAKLDVLEDIKQHFKESLGICFKEFIGSHERENLSFEVLACQQNEKYAQVHRLLQQHIGEQQGGAVVFMSSRKNTEALSEFLQQQKWECRYFHAGLEPNEKMDIQEAFIGGDLQVIVATNAFGMGVDKPDIRLVVHADITGSLENYLQEAGRAGRDQAEAHCVLLYSSEDIETQFRLGEQSRVSLRDIQQILRKLRSESKRRQGEVIITAGEILQDENVQTSFDIDDRGANNKVATAIAWLERDHFLKREENNTQVFPASLRLSQEAAFAKLQQAKLPANKMSRYQAIVKYLYDANMDERIDTDKLMLLTGASNEEIASILKQLEALGILYNDTKITLYLRKGITDPSSSRLEKSLLLEQQLFEILPELAPDAEQGEWQDMNIKALTHRLKEQQGLETTLPIELLRLIRSLSEDSDVDSQKANSFEIKQINADYIKLKLNPGLSWRAIKLLGEKRRYLSSKLLDFLLAKVPDKVRGKDLLVETTFKELEQLIEEDMELKAQIKTDKRSLAIQHVLLYLHKQKIVVLNHGMTVMRSAMRIEMDPNDKTRFLKENYQALDEFYREKRIQVHVMREYAELALKEMAEALRFVLSYFTDSKERFLAHYFAGKEHVLKLATSEQSWQQIMDGLNPIQKRIVSDEQDKNRLVLAGPGSGKTRVIVHRIAYLIRVKQIPAQSIITLTFNRRAANEIRSRLLSLIGSSAYGINVMTYHSMAMRLMGVSFDSKQQIGESDLQQVLQQAVNLLEGNGEVQDDDDPIRNQLLRGYRYILVDEYQDIDEWQYRLVAALAGMQTEEEGKLCIMAVGDDDQNIYAWRHSSNEYIEQFKQDYQAELSFLVENYRSSQAIITAANVMIEQNKQRMKLDHAITVNKQRMKDAFGGIWQAWDMQRQGRVALIRLPEDDAARGNKQAQAVMQEMQRLLALAKDNASYNHCAVLARTHQYLQTFQAYCEKHKIPYFLAAERDSLPLHRKRGFVAVIELLKQCEPQHGLSYWQTVQAQVDLDDEWQQFFQQAFEQLVAELGEAQLSIKATIDWLYQYAHELKQQTEAGLYLGTVHSAKGLEFAHVFLLDGAWSIDNDDERRLYYVGMTRAEQTLTLCQFGEQNHYPHSDTLFQLPFKGAMEPDLNTQYRVLTMRDVDIGYAGRFADSSVIHQAIKNLRVGDPLYFEARDNRYAILDKQGVEVGRTARSFQLDFAPEHCEVADIIVRYNEDSEEIYQKHNRSLQWEVVIPRVIGSVNQP